MSEHPCPKCGHCPTCGRSNQWYPYAQPYRWWFDQGTTVQPIPIQTTGYFGKNMA